MIKTSNEDVKKLDKYKIICICYGWKLSHIYLSIYSTYKKGHSIKGKHLLILINENRPSI